MGKRRNKERTPKARRARRSVWARLLAGFLGLLMAGCAGAAAVAFAMPALLEEAVTLPPQTVGWLAVGGAFVSGLLMVLVVARTRRKVAEVEFSRPELISVPVSDVEEMASLFRGEVHEAPVIPIHAARVEPPYVPPITAGASVAAVAAVAEPAPPLPDEVTFAPVELAAPPVPTPPVQPSPFAELAPEPEPVAPEPASGTEDAPAHGNGTRTVAGPDVVSGAWFAGPSKTGRRG